MSDHEGDSHHEDLAEEVKEEVKDAIDNFFGRGAHEDGHDATIQEREAEEDAEEARNEAEEAAEEPQEIAAAEECEGEGEGEGEIVASSTAESPKHEAKETPVAQGIFENGSPDPNIGYNKIYRCFDEGNGLLFRLVNEEDDHKWYFYNDTTDRVFRVIVTFKAYFSNLSKVVLIGKARKVKHPVVVQAPGEVSVELEVEPLSTEPFISGLVDDYKIEFSVDGVPQERDIVYNNGKPTVSSPYVYKCFSNKENGLLFRIVDPKTHRWYFYNDTPNYLMKVKCVFDRKLTVKPIGKAKAEKNPPAGNCNGVAVTLQVRPRETQPFIEGNGNTFKAYYDAELIN